MSKIGNTLSKKASKLIENKTVLVTGGAGSIGSALIAKLLQYDIHSVRAFDNDEYGLFKLGRRINDKRLRLLLGDVRDKDRISLALEKSEIVIHSAAIKNVEISEYNPIECIKTNIHGTINLIEASIRSKPDLFLNISTDKAVDFTTLYGATKFCGEKLVTWASKTLEKTKYTSVRLGNIIETRGNVFDVWQEEQHDNKPLSITDPAMRRYFWNINKAVDFIIECMIMMKGGEIFVPKMEKFGILDMARGISPKHKIIGPRYGEKLDEALISNEEKKIAKEFDNMWIIK